MKRSERLTCYLETKLYLVSSSRKLFYSSSQEYSKKILKYIKFWIQYVNGKHNCWTGSQDEQSKAIIKFCIVSIYIYFHLSNTATAAAPEAPLQRCYPRQNVLIKTWKKAINFLYFLREKWEFNIAPAAAGELGWHKQFSMSNKVWKIMAVMEGWGLPVIVTSSAL